MSASSAGRCGARVCCADDAGRHRLAAVEELDVNPLRRHAHGGERLFHLRHEASRPADVDVRVSWNADLVEDRSRQVTGRVEVLGIVSCEPGLL